MKRTLILLLLVLVSLTSSFAYPILYFFESPTCPHCQNMRSYINQLKNEYDFEVKLLSVSDKENLLLLNEMACAYNYTLEGVPTFFINNKVFVGDGESAKQGILNEILYCSNNTCLDPLDITKKSEYRCQLSMDDGDKGGFSGVFIGFGIVIALVVVGYAITKHK